MKELSVVKSVEKLNHKHVVVSILGLMILVYFFPYTGDDWAWGSAIGIERLMGFFEDYNGRYLGNLTVLILTRYNILRVFVVSSTLVGIAYYCTKIVDKNSYKIFTLMMVFIIAMPVGIMSQAVVWTSGFSNYTISILILLVCLDKCMNSKMENHTISTNALVLLLSFSVTLFVEHTTILCVLIAVSFLFYSLIKRKIKPIYLSYIVGTFCGTVLMFSNGSYHKIVANDDYYRTISLSIIEIIKQAYENYGTIIYKDLAFNNILLNLIMCITFIVLFRKSILKNNISKKGILTVKVLLIITISFTVYTILCAFNPAWNILGSSRITTIFEGVYTVIFFLSIPILVYFLIDDKTKRYRIFVEYLAIILTISPLFVVTPIGSRCFILPYVIMAIIISELFDTAFDEENNYLNSLILNGIKIIGISVFVFLISIYSTIYNFKIEELNTIKAEYNKGVNEFQISEVPYSEYVWNGSPIGNESLEKRYKLFYNLDRSIIFESKDDI